MINNPSVIIRIGSAILAAGTLVGIVAAGIAIGLIVSRQSGNTPFSRTSTVVRSDISIALDRLVATNEYSFFYDAPATLRDLIDSSNEQLKFSFPQTAVKFVVSSFSERPTPISSISNRARRQLGERPSLVIVNGSAYFTQNYTGAEIAAAFRSFTRTITLVNLLGDPSSAVGTLSSKYSSFSDTRPVNLTINQTASLVSISLSNFVISNRSTISFTG